MQRRRDDPVLAQRAIVLQLLGGERPQWTRSELAGAISDIDPRAIGKALVQLARDGVVRRTRPGLAMRAAP